MPKLKTSMTTFLYIFIAAFLLNLTWENLHSYLYLNYQGGDITQFILFRASLGDALIISVISIPFIYFSFFKKNPWIIVIIGIFLAIVIEWYALRTGRWAYNGYMPLLPYISVGLTPTIQLGITGYFVLKLRNILQGHLVTE